MIAGIMHSGSGLGNQLFRYVATRVLALEKDYDFTMVAPENFKGKSFMNLDMGLDAGFTYTTEMPAGKVIPIPPNFNPDSHLPPVIWEEKTNYYNPEYNFIEDNTIIDGEFQSIQYFGHRLKNIDEWLKVERIKAPRDLCVIGFRGGEFYVFPELGLPKEYFDKAIRHIKLINPNMRFEVHTDDPIVAKQFFPDYPIIQDIEINWRSMRYAKYAIISNSSFYILPRLLSDGLTIAPRWWARHNTGEWSRPDNYYRDFKYINV